jgi:putative ABC transport system substrate-binding protein
MKRREFITMIGGVAAWPLVAHAQQSERMRRIGLLMSTVQTDPEEIASVAAFGQTLERAGWIPGRNVTIDHRWAEGREEVYAEVAAEFVRRKVDVIVTAGTDASLVVKKTTSEIPIVFAAVGDPVGTGLVASLAHPGGNVTGLSNEQADLAGYRLELLHGVIPSVRRVALLGNTGSPLVLLEMKTAEEAAPKLGLEAFRLGVTKTEDIEPAFESMKGRADALYVCADSLTSTNRVSINILAIGEKLPTMNSFRNYVEAGGLISYGPNFPDLFRRAGDFVNKILRGGKPADLPVEQPVKFDLMINATTAKVLGLTIPKKILVRASEVF